MVHCLFKWLQYVRDRRILWRLTAKKYFIYLKIKSSLTKIHASMMGALQRYPMHIKYRPCTGLKVLDARHVSNFSVESALMALVRTGT